MKHPEPDLNTITRAQALAYFRRLVGEIGLNGEALADLADRAINYYAKGVDPNPLQPLFDAWYGATDEPAWSVYDDERYLSEAFACWWIYSRRYINTIAKTPLLDETGSIIDVGCGIGFSTIQLAAHYPNAMVYGTQLGGYQALIAERIGVTLHTTPPNDLAADTLFASEYFEHFQSPGEHLNDLLTAHRPTTVIHASTFRQPSIGHFNQYQFDGFPVDGSATARRFNRLLNAARFHKVEMGFWNNRPAVYQRSDAFTQLALL